jgi:hypothetical protein
MDDLIQSIFTSPVAIIGFLFFVLVIVPFIVFFTRPIMQMRLAKALREGGLPTDGRVTALKHDVGQNARTKAQVDFYSVGYEYAVGGQTYANRHSVRGEVYHTLREGGAVSVLYLPATPEKSMVAGAVQRSQP